MIPISVILPMYNASDTIKECVDSVLAQTFKDFELLVADDGSQDNSCQIVSKYQDPRIRLIRCQHNYIDTLNSLLNEAKGKYIARMDADDAMMPNRLRLQYEYMEAHPEVAAMGGAIEEYSSQRRHRNIPAVTAADLLEGCGMYNPTSILRAEVVKKYKLKYKHDFVYAEDFRFWADMIKHNLIIHNIDDVLVRYRVSQKQVSNQHSHEQQDATRRTRIDLMKWIKKQEAEVKQDYRVLPQSGNKLSVCISFLNEGEEVGKTVRSIRATAGDRVDIIAINDASTDGYDYETDLKGLSVNYFVNKRRIGSAAGKEKAVKISSTPYFILLDAHMRFYQTDWVDHIVGTLEHNPRQILCCQNQALKKNADGTIENTGEMGTFGAYLRFDNNDYIPQIIWNGNKDTDGLEEWQIPAVLGACYCSSKDYWNKLRGFEGLTHYGSEEAYISLKAWLEGGGCRLLNDVSIGHIYREKAPYKMVNLNTTFNHLVITETLFPTPEKARARAMAKKLNNELYTKMQDLLSVYKTSLEKLSNYYQQTFTAHNFAFIRKINNRPNNDSKLIIQHNKDRLPGIINDIKEWTENMKDLSLGNGKSGAMLALACYSLAFNNENADKKASFLLTDILNSLPNSDLPYGFNSGYAGIGWALIFLIHNNLLDNSLDQELAYIDSRIMELSPKRISNLSFETGAGGLLAYINARLSMTSYKGESHPFSQEYLSEVFLLCQSITTYISPDIKTLIPAEIFWACYKQKRWKDIPLLFEDVFSLPVFLPKERQYQKDGIGGRVGFALFLIQEILSENNCLPHSTITKTLKL